jgi:hypothetical protein
VIEIHSLSLESIFKHSLKDTTSSFLLKEFWGVKKRASLGQARLLLAPASLSSREGSRNARRREGSPASSRLK